MSDDVRLPRDWVLCGLPEFEWSSAESVRYEVALDVLSQLVAACTSRTAAEQNKPSPNQAVIDECARLQVDFTQERRRLRSTDQEAIEDVLGRAKELDRHITHDL